MGEGHLARESTSMANDHCKIAIGSRPFLQPSHRMPGHKLDSLQGYKSDLNAEHPLTREQVDFYQQNGYIRLKQVSHSGTLCSALVKYIL